MLLENSLYTNQAERDALVKDKKRVMDALCFSLLGFLGCYQLAQNRGALKTYQQSEGKLQLNSISDTNHDVSLSVKLAEEAHVIPQAAAMAVTKLLYKIKSKQVKGPLDENLVRSMIKLLKIASNRPDTMVYSVVSQFEDGSIGLGQLAQKLYNLSKIKNFQSVSGEFRTLVMKGQYQELFNKLPKTGAAPATVAPSITNTAAPKAVQAPSVSAKPTFRPSADVPLVIKKLEQTGFTGVSDAVLQPLFKDMLTQFNWTPAVMRDNVIKFCKKNLINIDVPVPNVASVAVKELEKFLNARWTKNDFTWMGAPPEQSPKWIAGMDGSAVVVAIGRLAWLYAYAYHRHLIFEGKWKEYEMALGRLYMKQDSSWRVYYLDDYKEDYINRILESKLYWDAFEKYKGLFANLLNFIFGSIMHAGGYSMRGFNPINFKMSPQIWAMLFNKYTITGIAYWKRMLADSWRTNSQASTAFVSAFGLEKSNITVKATGNRSVTVTAKEDVFKNNPDLDRAYKALIDNGQVKPVDITDTFSSLTKEALSLSKTTSSNEFFVNLCSFSKDVFGNVVMITSEKFVDWLSDQLVSRAIDNKIFEHLPDSSYVDDTFCKFAWTVFVAYADKISNLPFWIWMRVYKWGFSADSKINDPNRNKIMAELFEKNGRSFDASQINQQMEEGLSASSGSVIAIMAEAHKKGLFDMPTTLSPKAWSFIAMYGPKDVSVVKPLWNFTPEVAKSIFSGYGTVGWRAEMFRTFPLIRDAYMQNWYNRCKTITASGSGWVESLRSFLRECYGSSLDEDMIKPEIRDMVLDCIEHINTARVAYNELAWNGDKIPEWMDKPIRENLLKDARQNLSMNSITNIDKLEGTKALNTYINQGTIQEFADKIVINDTTSASQLSGLLEKIANDPSGFNVQSLLRLAYAMHKNSKTMAMMGTTQTTKACYDSICEALNTMMSAGRIDEVNQVYDALSFAPDLRTKIVDWFRKANQLKNALESVKADAIHALIDIDQKRMNQLMRYNNIKFPSLKRNKDTKLSDIVTAHNSFDLEPLAVSDENLDEKAMLRRTAEYDAFNKYRHGQIGIKFLKSFNVDIPSQKAANAVWNDAHPNSERMDPVFHGTGSVAATFVLRYGFAVVSANDASVVGRMLGNGIYFSNVLDKAAQYIGDSGYSRGKGTKGYLLQMKANLGQRGTDYKSQESNLVSPEWCVFHPNDQLNIYKAHFVEIVNKSEIDRIKSEVNLNENFFKVEQFKEHLNEDLQNPVAKGCISYTFMDGRIPVSESMTIDFEEFDPTEYGPHVSLEPSGLGPVIYIQIDDPEVNEIYAIRYTVQFMNQSEDFELFLNRLAGTQVK